MNNWLKTSFTQIGKTATLFYIGDKILQAIGIGSIYPYCFLAQPLEEHTGRQVRLSKNFRIEKITEDEPTLQTILEPAIARDRFEQGAICVGAFKEDRLVALLWFTPGTYHEDEVRADFVPPKEGCWDFGVHIEPEYRLTRAFSSLWLISTGIMRGQGFTTSLSRISAFNPGSLKAHRRMGARLLGKAVFINIGPVQFCFSNVAQRLHISLSARSRPVFRF